MSDVAVLLANGFEEIEAIAVIDILRRADIDTRILALKDKAVTSARGLVVQADALLESATRDDFKMIVLPGGPGVENLQKDPRVASMLEKQLGRDAWIGAICAAPTVLASHGMLKGRSVTGYPGTEDKLRQGQAKVTGERVVVDGKLITSRGPGTAVDFALELVAALKGKALSDTVRGALAG